MAEQNLQRRPTDSRSTDAPIREAVLDAREGIEDLVSTVRSSEGDRSIVLRRDDANRAFLTHEDGDWRGCVQIAANDDWETTGWREFDEGTFWGTLGWCIEGDTGEVAEAPTVATPLSDE